MSKHLIGRAKNGSFAWLKRFLADQRGSGDLTTYVLLTAAGAAMVAITVPSLFSSSQSAASTFQNQVNVLERGAGGTAAGGGGAGGAAGGGGAGWQFNVGPNGVSASGPGGSVSAGTNGVSGTVGGGGGAGGGINTAGAAGTALGAGANNQINAGANNQINAQRQALTTVPP